MPRSAILLAALLVLVAAAAARPAGPLRALKQMVNGVGPQIYTCNGTSWVNTNSNVSFSCTGTGAGTTGVHNVIGGVPSYTFNCGFVQGNTSNQIMVPKPNGAPTDLPIYRRSAINGSGCVMGIEYITRTETMGGQPESTACNSSMVNQTMALVYSATFAFWMC